MKKILTDCFIEIDGVELTDHISSVGINMSAEEIDTTTYADEGHRRAAGLGDDSFDLNIKSDFDAGSVDEVLYPLHQAGGDFLVRVRADSDPVAANNPEWSGTCILLAYQPLAGEAGDLSQTSITLPVQGARIVRATS